MATATLTCSLSWDYQDWRGHDHETDVEVVYTFDGTDIQLVELNYAGDDLPEGEVDALIDYIADVYAPEAYSEWLADCDEHFAELRAPESYIPARAA